MEQDAPALLQLAIASKLQELGVRVRLFSDEFRKTGNAQQSIIVLVGHAASEYQWSVERPSPAGFEIAQFEIRVEVAELHSHERAFKYLGMAMSALTGHSPVTGCHPIIPMRYAPQGYDSAAGKWVYSGLVRSSIIRPSSYQLKSEIQPVTQVKIGIWREGFLQSQTDINLLVPSNP